MNNPAESPVVASQNPSLIAEHITNVWETIQAEKLESYKNIFRAFSTMSDVQALLELNIENVGDVQMTSMSANDTFTVNDMLNKAKKILHQAVTATPENAAVYREAMATAWD